MLFNDLCELPNATGVLLVTFIEDADLRLAFSKCFLCLDELLLLAFRTVAETLPPAEKATKQSGSNTGKYRFNVISNERSDPATKFCT